MNTNKPRKLVASKYNERRSECEEALAALQKVQPLQQLTDLSPEAFAAWAQHLPNEVIRKRARHVVHENDRVKQAVAALEAGNLPGLGALLNASHASLRDDYEVTGAELDALAAATQKHPACIGARMTGAGFGGCAIALVEKNALDDFEKTVVEEYTKVIGYAPDVYRV